jgi:hypothetical protein
MAFSSQVATGFPQHPTQLLPENFGDDEMQMNRTKL